MKKIISTLGVLIFSLTLVSCSNLPFKSFSFKHILPEEVKAKLDSEAEFKIIDVRETDEYEQGHIANAISLPFETGHFKEQYPNLDWSKDILIATVDSNEQRAAQAGTMLLNSGFTNVKVLTGGMLSWQKKGYPMVE